MSKYDKYVEELQQDAFTMALRLLGEDERTFSRECREVMDRWRPIAERVLNAAPQQPDIFEEMCDIVRRHAQKRKE